MQAALQLTKGDYREWWERQRKSLVASCHLWRMLPLHAILVGHKTSQETAPIPVMVCLNCCHLADATDLPKFTQADLETVSFRELYTSWKVIYTKYHCTQISLYAALQFLHFKTPLVFIIILYLYLFCVFLHHRGALRISLFALLAMTIKAILIGAYLLVSSIRMAERAWWRRETSRRLRLFRSPSPGAHIALVALFDELL